MSTPKEIMEIARQMAKDSPCQICVIKEDGIEIGAVDLGRKVRGR